MHRLRLGFLRFWSCRSGPCGLVLALAVLLLGRAAWGQQRPSMASPSTASQFVRTQWTAVDEGMPSNGVRDIVQIEGAYLWLGTEGGLVRFDGSAFEETRFTRREAESRVIDRILDLQAYSGGLLVLYRSRDLLHYRPDRVRTVAEAVWAHQVGRDGRLWVGTEAGVSVYEDSTRTRVAPEHIDATVRALRRTADGTLWVGTETQGLYRRTPDGTVVQLTEEEGLLSNTVTAFGEDDGTMLVGTAAGLQRWTAGELVAVPPANPATGPLQVVTIQGDVQGTCWAQTLRAVYRCQEGELVPYTGAERSYRLRPKFLSDDFVQEGPGGHLLVNAGRTLYRDGVPIFETDFAIWSVTPDRDGTLWVGTGSRGLFQLRPSTFAVYGTEEGLPSNKVITIARRRDSSVWMGTRAGHLVHFRNGRPRAYTLEKNGRPLRPLFAIHEDRSGRLWVGGTRLCRVENGQCARPEAPGPIPQTLITAIHEDRQGRLWVGTHGDGLFRRDSSASGTSWTHLTPQNSPLPSREVRWIHESPSGALWVSLVGAAGRLVRYRDGAFEALSDPLLSGDNPSFIHQEVPGVLWVGSNEAGLHRVDVRGVEALDEATVTAYRQRDGLPQNTIYQVMGDERGRFWISTPNGIIQVEKASLEAVARDERERVSSVVYTTRDGLRNMEGNSFGTPGAIQTPDGRLWFPNQAGATVVDPAAVPVAPRPPRMHVESVSSHGRLVTDAVASGRPGDAAVQLAEGQRTFRVEYTGIRLDMPHALDFRYRLAGLQDDWVEAGRRRTAFFTEVPPGRYTFEVAGRTRNGPWSPTPARLTVTVAPYFYETWWFAGFCVLALGVAGYGGVQYRLYTLRRRKEELNQEVETRTQELAVAKEEAEHARAEVEEALETVEEQAQELRKIDEMKSRFFANVSHELRTPLSLMQAPIAEMLTTDLPETERETLQIVRRNAERLERLVEQLLGLARYDAGRLELACRRQAWGPFVRRVVQRFTPMAEATAVKLSVQGAGADEAVVFDPDHMETVVANLVRNALTYTPRGGEVTVRAAVTEEEGRLAVTDTGPGIPAEEQEALFDRFYRGAGQARRGGTGIGLSLTKALVTLHDGTIQVKSEPGAGSTFAVQWPRTLSVDEEADGHREPARTQTFDEFESAPDANSETGHGDRTTVLIVEDNADVRRYVRTLLEPQYRVIEAEHGRDGLKRTRSALPDLVVADVMMPEMNGIEMVEALRRRPRTDTIPVVMLTARAEAADQVEGLEGGADAYVTKPFDASVLTARIDSLIATRRQLRERFRDGAPGTAEFAGGASSPEAGAASFEERVRAVVNEHLADPAFSVEQLAEAVGRTRRTVTRKTKETFGQTPSALIRTLRVERGAALLDKEEGTVSEIAYAVGFNSLSYFSRCFKDHFGVPPSVYRDS